MRSHGRLLMIQKKDLQLKKFKPSCYLLWSSLFFMGETSWSLGVAGPNPSTDCVLELVRLLSIRALLWRSVGTLLLRSVRVCCRVGNVLVEQLPGLGIPGVEQSRHYFLSVLWKVVLVVIRFNNNHCVYYHDQDRDIYYFQYRHVNPSNIYLGLNQPLDWEPT